MDLDGRGGVEQGPRHGMNVVRSCPVVIETSSSRKKQLAGVHTQPVEGVLHVAKHPVHGQRKPHLDGRYNQRGGLTLIAADRGVRAQHEVLADEGKTGEVTEDAALVFAWRQQLRPNLLLPQAEQSFRLDRPLREVRNSFEKSYFEFHLARESGSMTRVAETTGLERTHLYRKLKQLGVDFSRSKRGILNKPV